MSVFGREPAFWIGLIATLLVGLITTLNGNGLVSDAAAGKVKDIVTALVQLLTLIAPLVAGLAIRPAVTPVISLPNAPKS